MATFRTRARTVDMLGRQQIAGIPTAISELFKNAHDAYADVAIVDFFRSDRLFVLRDDGLGMTENDYERRWLTLGTESKVETSGDLGPPPKRRGYRTRAVLGEKGIGRLAIAAIGPQTLMLSRPLRDEGLGDLLVSFVNWSMFELPSADLSEIEVPTVSLAGGSIPSKSDIVTLVGWVEDNLASIASRRDRRLVQRIKRELDDFQSVDPTELVDVLGSPSVLEGPGTHFYIRPASSLIAAELDAGDTRETSTLRKTLVGFANTMTPGHPPPALRTEFRDHYTEDAYEDVISDTEFFTPTEFLAADHHITGRFDEFGQFEGTVSVYGDDPVRYDLAWPEARGRETRCGPFQFSLAYVQGELKNSRLDPALFRDISSKLDRYGGLYIYRDGIRVLPYGNTDYDFLDIEVRRAKSASDAFFSYRRMFGVIELTRQENSELREKAGREGFSDNDAYREFRRILMAFLYRVAFDFFREAGSLAEQFLVRRDELERLDKARKARAKQIRPQRNALAQNLEHFFALAAGDAPQAQVSQVLRRLEARTQAALTADDPGEAAERLVAAETQAREALSKVSAEYEVRRPRGLGLTLQLRRDVAAYEAERARLSEQVFAPAWQTIEETVTTAARTHRLAVDRRLRFDSAVAQTARRGSDVARRERRQLEGATRQTRDHALELARERTAAVEEAVQTTLRQAARIDVSKLSDRDFVRQRTALERELDSVAQQHAEALSSVTNQLGAIIWPTNGRGPVVTHFDELEALETDLEALRERAHEDLELTQLGMAIEVINHEFQGTVRSIRRSLRRIKGWADANPDLREPYRELRTSFDHLDGYLRLFTPLQRRLHRDKVEISGAELERFLRDVFEKRLKAAEVRLIATDAFAQHRLLQFPSTIYPVFVNLVDNAIWWLANYRGERTITLDAFDRCMVVRDSGPGVPAQHKDAIFEAGFTLKPGGRGYGLHISREVLEREGMVLELAPSVADRGAEFIVREAA